jgi:hypothetical protein
LLGQRPAGLALQAGQHPARDARARTRTSRRKKRAATTANASSSLARSQNPSTSSTLASAATLGTSLPTLPEAAGVLGRCKGASATAALTMAARRRLSWRSSCGARRRRA